MLELQQKIQDLADSLLAFLNSHTTITLDELRSFLAEKSLDGKNLEVRQILLNLGANCLNDINSNKYHLIMAKAKNYKEAQWNVNI
ncbi:MAG: hypothetical protein R3Y35_12355 [Clostridia bacterium]